MASQHGSFIWYELMTTDIDTAIQFYGAVLGWAAQDSLTPDVDYRLWSMDGVMVGGLMATPSEAAAIGLGPILRSSK